MKRIKLGDKVRVISGKLYGKEGTVIAVCNKCQSAKVEGINKVKCHKKPSQGQDKGGIVETEAFIPLCKLALVAPKSTRGVSKIKYVIKYGKKIRVAKKTNLEIATSKK